MFPGSLSNCELYSLVWQWYGRWRHLLCGNGGGSGQVRDANSGSIKNAHPVVLAFPDFAYIREFWSELGSCLTRAEEKTKDYCGSLQMSSCICRKITKYRQASAPSLFCSAYSKNWLTCRDTGG